LTAPARLHVPLEVLTKVLIIQDNYKEAYNQIELAKDELLWLLDLFLTVSQKQDEWPRFHPGFASASA